MSELNSNTAKQIMVASLFIESTGETLGIKQFNVCVFVECVFVEFVHNYAQDKNNARNKITVLFHL